MTGETPTQRERALSKTVTLVATLAEALQHRGVEARLAILMAKRGMAAACDAATTSTDDAAQVLDAHLRRSCEHLRARLSIRRPSRKRLTQYDSMLAK